MDLFLIKKLVASLMMPLPLLLLLMAWGVLSLLRRKYTTATFQMLTSFVLLVVISLPFIPNYLLKKLESQYPQYDLSKPASIIVVLGAGHTNDGAIPISSRLGRASIYRINEALRISMANANSKIFLTGGAAYNDLATAVVNESALLSLGVRADNLVVADDKAKDTFEEAQALYPKLKGKSFVLVTSASHMPRAIKEFRAIGLHPNAAPTDHLVKTPIVSYWWNMGPNPNNIKKLNTWWYETLGLIWIKIRPNS